MCINCANRPLAPGNKNHCPRCIERLAKRSKNPYKTVWQKLATDERCSVTVRDKFILNHHLKKHGLQITPTGLDMIPPPEPKTVADQVAEDMANDQTTQDGETLKPINP